MLGDNLRRRHRSTGPARQEPPVDWVRWLLVAVGSIALAFGTGFAVAVFVLFPAPETTVDGAIPVPAIVGLDLTEAGTELRGLGLGVGEVMELPHPAERPGTILGQSPLAGQQLQEGAVVHVAVSAGRARAVIPDVLGLPGDEAATLAERLGFAVTRRDVVAPGAPGRVVELDPEPGAERELPATLTLTISVPPPDPFANDSLADPDAGALPAITPDTMWESTPRPRP